MAKKNKTAAPASTVAEPKKRAASAAKDKARATKAKPSVAKAKPRIAKPISVPANALVAKKRSASRLSLTIPLARARKLAGDLYEAAGLAFWTEAIEAAAEQKKTELINLQDSVCEAADFLREAKATNPKHMQLFWVACFDRHGLPSTAPCFITAADEEEALALWRDAFKGEYGRRRPHALPVPTLADAPGLHP
jgi:hypothetical protein